MASWQRARLALCGTGSGSGSGTGTLSGGSNADVAMPMSSDSAIGHSDHAIRYEWADCDRPGVTVTRERTSSLRCVESSDAR